MLQAIIAVGTFLATFFPRVAKWLGQFSKYFNTDTAIAVARFTFFKTKVFLLYGFIVSTFVAVVTTLVMIYNEINNLIDFINLLATSGSGSSGSFDVGCIFYFCKIIGITDAINSSLPFVFSAISFYILRIFYMATYSAYSRLITASDFLMKK